MEEQNRNTNTQMDKAFVSIQTNLIDTMGSLGNLWMLFEDIRSKIDNGCDDPSAQAHVDNVGCRHILDLLEKTICLEGQSNVAINYQRRLSVRQRINNQDSKKASEFKEELKEWSKSKKEASEIALVLSGGKKKSHKKKVVNYDTPRQVQQSQRWKQKESYQEKPPIQSRPPSHSQGARNSGGRDNSRGNSFQRGNKRPGISKKVKIFCKELGNNHLRQKDTKRYPKCRGKFSVTSDTTERSKNECIQSKRKTPNVNRGQRNVDKKSHCTSKTMQGSNPKQLVLSTQQRWGSMTSVKLKKIKPTCIVPTFQNRRIVHDQRPAKKGRLHAKNRPKGGLFGFVHQSKTQNISEVQMGRNPV
ncbi:unnamed protein product [Mytilus coruscus]|uniref:Uncharacterized protein n=1 Tax=Mytilus coruscus TaxID=42192 RepID=A0A6J7ZZM5_MYTCO|nr:unnamed protein product [Mytilus coruscus]